LAQRGIVAFRKALPEGDRGKPEDAEYNGYSQNYIDDQAYPAVL
jgi:hypothetical protein